MAVAHNLPRLATRGRKSQAVNHVVQPALQLLQEQFAGYTWLARGFLKVVAELVFQGEIHALGFLLFPELQAVAYDLGFAVLAMLAGSEVALFHGALICEALGPFQKQFHAFATAKAAYCTFITCHFFSPAFRCRSVYGVATLSSRSVS